MKYQIIGVLLALVIVYINFGNKEGTPPTFAFDWYPWVRDGSIYINDYHIHHWLISFIILIFTFNKTGKKWSVINGMLVVLVIQGLSYKDRFNF